MAAGALAHGHSHGGVACTGDHHQQEEGAKGSIGHGEIEKSADGAGGVVAIDDVTYEPYKDEHQLPAIMELISSELSEPYSIYTYRYFIHNWPNLSFVAIQEDRCVGTIVCKLAKHKSGPYRGYIAMLAVDQRVRKRRIGTNLVRRAIVAMIDANADEVVLETEVTNTGAIALYEKLGFARDKMLYRYYLNGVDAIRLKLWLK